MLTIENNNGSVDICSDGVRILAYQANTAASKPHFSVVALPPSGPRAGTNIALAAPHDHVWHLGLYFSPKYVNGVNFWESELFAANEESFGHLRHVGAVSTSVQDDGSVAFAHEIHWLTDKDELWIKEDRRILVHPPKGQAYRMEWISTWRAEGTDRVLTSRCATGDYAGLSFRPQRCMGGLGTKVMNSEGANSADQVHGQTANWVDYSGKLDGKYTINEADWAGLTMIDHPSNVHYPIRWFCITQPFGFLAANPTFGRTWTLKPDQPETARFGILVHAGQPDKHTIDGEYQSFIKSS